MGAFRIIRHVLVVLALALAVAACSEDGADGSDVAGADSTSSTDTSTSTTEATTTTAVEPITVLVSNDDGIGAPGIDTLVNALDEIDDLEVVVVAPAENQSGSSDTTTPGGAPHAAGATVSGVSGTAVSGTPADSINVAFGELGIEPDLVVSGVNEGQNVGPFAALSGTVGAARTAIRAGVPAVAASAGLGEDADYAAATELVVDWIIENRDAIVDGSLSTDHVVSFNVPGCTSGDVGELVEVPLATTIPEGVNVFQTDCSIEPAGVPANDIEALMGGFAAETLVPAEL